MDNQQEQLDTLREIRSLMVRSSKFLSLSGLSGVIAGVAAIVGIGAAYLYLELAPADPGYYRLATLDNHKANPSFYTFMIADMSIVFIVAFLGASFLTRRKAKLNGVPIWDATAKRLLINLAIPLVAGGLYGLILLYHGLIAFIAPVSLLFYGMALINASKYTLPDIRYLGLVEMITGLLASFFIEYGLLFWLFGFGIAHIIYGIRMYLTYEK